MIEVKNLEKSFGEQKVLNDVSLVCPNGEITGIIGHNGSGKTVLFKCICGLLFEDSGEILIDGKRYKSGGELIKNAGIIIENPAFLESESGINNLKYLFEIRNKKNMELLREIMRMVGLDPESKKKVKNFSLGMKQRLAIAQAIMEDPAVLILDEPMNGLDRHGVEEMRQIFCKEKQKGKTILLASHNREDIEALCDHVYEMEDGQIKQLRQKNYLLKDAKLWRIFCKGEKGCGQEKQDGGRKDEIFCFSVSVDIIFHEEGEDNACKIQCNIDPVVVFAKDTIQCIEDCDDEDYAGQDSEGTCPEEIGWHFFMEEEQFDQREQKHWEEEQLQMLPCGFVDGREQPDDAVVVRPFIGEMQQHSEDGDEDKTDGVGFEFHVGLSFLDSQI